MDNKHPIGTRVIRGKPEPGKSSLAPKVFPRFFFVSPPPK